MHIILRTYMIWLRIWQFLFKPLFWLLFDGFKRSDFFPPLSNEILQISAIDLASKIRNKELKSVEVVRAYIARIKEVNTFLNAVVEDRFIDALADAEKADKMCAELSVEVLAKSHPLLGVPVTVKGSIAVDGLPHCVGSVSRISYKAKEDAAIIKKIRAVGAIPLLVSNTPEYCASAECHNLVYGRTCNPYDSARSSGGSSGGEGALLGCGASIFGIASDVGGSIRIPALCNGVFGHKPTANIVPNDGHFPTSKNEFFRSCLGIGPMCRYAKDLPFLFSLMHEEIFLDKLKLDEEVDIKQIKVCYLESMGFTLGLPRVDKSIQSLILKSAEYFKFKGLEVEKPDLGDLTETCEMLVGQSVIIDDLPFIMDDKEDLSLKKDYFKELFKALFGRSKYSLMGLLFYLSKVTGGFLTESQKQTYDTNFKEFKKMMMTFFGTNTVLLYPTQQSPALRHYESIFRIANVSYTAIVNLLGCPSTHVPCGLDSNGLPIGFQVIAGPYQDRLCFAIAAELESLHGGFKFERNLP